MNPKLVKLLEKSASRDPTEAERTRNTAIATLESGSDVMVLTASGTDRSALALIVGREFADRGTCWYVAPATSLTRFRVALMQKAATVSASVMTSWRRDEKTTGLVLWSAPVLCDFLVDFAPPDLLILDEAEYLADDDILWRLAPNVSVLLLMEPVPNANSIRSWLESVRKRPCRLLEQKTSLMSPVPALYGPEEGLIPLLNRKRLSNKAHQWLKANAPQRPNIRVAGVLNKERLTPALIVFPTGEACDKAARDTPQKSRSNISEIATSEPVSSVLECFPLLKNHPDLPRVLARRVASVHLGQAPEWRALTEAMLAGGFLDYLFATLHAALELTTRVRSLVLTASPEKTALRRIVRLLQKPGAKAGCLVVVPTDEMDVAQVKNRFLAHPGPLLGRHVCNTARAFLELEDTLFAYQSQGFDDTRPGELLEEMRAELPDARCPAPWAVLELKDLRLELELKLTHRRQKALSRMLSGLPCQQCNHESLCHGKHYGSRRLRLLMEELYEMKSRPDEHPGLLRQSCCFHREYLRDLGLTDAAGTGRMVLGLGIKSPEILAVCVERGAVPLSDPSLSIAMVGGFADCAPGQGPRLVPKFLTRDLEQGMARLIEFLSALQEQTLRWGKVVKKPIAAQSAAVMAWNQGEDLEYLAAETGMTPGALTSLIEQSTLLMERLRALYRQKYKT